MGFWFEQLQALEACEQDKNPIVGDPPRISSLAQQLNGTAQSLKVQADRLRAVSTDQFWKGDAASEFMHLKEKLPPLLDKVVARYGAVGDALAKYSPDLQQAQESATRALQAYRDAKSQQQTAQTNCSTYNQLRLKAITEHREFQWTGPNPGTQLDDANNAVSNAIRMMTNAIDTRNAVASTCSGRINDAIHDDLKNDDSLWGKLKRVGKKIVEVLEKVAPVLRKIAGVLGVAAALLGWVPILGEVLAGAALVVGAVTLAVDLILKAAGKDVSWGTILTDAIGVIPIGRATRLAKEAGAVKPGVLAAAKGLLKGDVSGVKGLVNFGKSVAEQVGPAYKSIAAATKSVATGGSTVSSIARGALTEFTQLGGLKGVAKDIGVPTLVLSGKKIYDLFAGGDGASASATAPTNPTAITTGLPVGAQAAPTGVVGQPVSLPVAA